MFVEEISVREKSVRRGISVRKGISVREKKIVTPYLFFADGNQVWPKL